MMKAYHYTVRMGLGISLPAKTFLIEGDHDLYIISPGPFGKEIQKLLNHTNKKINFISPNNFHNIFLKKAKELYPNADFYGPKRSMKVSGVKLLPLEELKQAELKQFKIAGHKTLSETCFYDRKNKALYVTDLIFNMHHQMNLVTKFLLKLTGTYHKIGTSRLLKSGINDRAKFNKSLLNLLTIDIEKVYLNHGDEISFGEFKEHIENIAL